MGRIFETSEEEHEERRRLGRARDTLPAPSAQESQKSIHIRLDSSAFQHIWAGRKRAITLSTEPHTKNVTLVEHDGSDYTGRALSAQVTLTESLFPGLDLIHLGNVRKI